MKYQQIKYHMRTLIYILGCIIIGLGVAEIREYVKVPEWQALAGLLFISIVWYVLVLHSKEAKK